MSNRTEMQEFNSIDEVNIWLDLHPNYKIINVSIVNEKWNWKVGFFTSEKTYTVTYEVK